MNILILGSGGREHALAWAVLQNPRCDRLIVAPGNGGIGRVAECADLDIEDGAAVAAFADEQGVDLVIVGPEGPLAAGVADALAEAGIACFGPSAAAARVEASKTFTKALCDAVGAPTADWARFDALAPALDHLARVGAPIVVKADGLAAGKGVTVAETPEAAEAALRDVFDGLHGRAEVVLESVLSGEEASFFCLVDGTDVLAIGTAQDHKRAGDGDTGPNTGGMGAYSPAPVMTPGVEAAALDRIVRPCMAELARRGTPYRGVLFVGLMIEDGVPSLVEFNARFGDPECQCLMMRLGGAGAGPDAGLRRRAARRGAGALGGRPRALRGDGRVRLSRPLRQGRRGGRAGRPARGQPADDVPRGHRARGGAVRRHRGARAGPDGAGRDPARGPGRGLRDGGRGGLARRHGAPRHRLARPVTWEGSALVAARWLIAALFAAGAVQKAMDPSGAGALLAGFGLPEALVWPALAFNAVAAIALLAGWQVAPVALLLALYCGVTSVFHWVPDDPWQMSIFVKNWAIAGGCLALAVAARAMDA